MKMTLIARLNRIDELKKRIKTIMDLNLNGLISERRMKGNIILCHKAIKAHKKHINAKD